jgi:Protein of unknown function (DUF3300)
MKRWIALVLLAALALWQAPSQAQARVYNQAELDALLAPVALYPDPVLSHILIAATYRDDLRDAAAWSRANPHLAGEDAVRAVEPLPWHPSVKALVAFPELLARMHESPQWAADLGAAFLEQEPHVMDTVQALRRRAQASGYLQNNPQQQLYEEGQAISVYPAQPQVVYVPYYDPYVVYGPWWWTSYRPVYWRPWFARPAVFVSTSVFVTRVDWRRRHVVGHAHHSQPYVRRIQSAAPVTIHNHAHPVRPIVDSVRLPQPAAQPGREVRREFHRERGAHAAPAVPVQQHAQPAAQPRRSEAQREVHRDRRGQAARPAIVQSPAQVLRPIADPVRIYQHQTAPQAYHRPQARSEIPHSARPSGQPGQARQAHRQGSERRR